MYGALFEIESWMGKQQHIFEGEDASALLSGLERVQDLGCLVRVGKMEEDTPEGKKAVRKLEKILDEHYSGTLTIKKLLTMDLEFCIGTLKCVTVVEGDEAIVKLRADHPKAK